MNPLSEKAAKYPNSLLSLHERLENKRKAFARELNEHEIAFKSISLYKRGVLVKFHDQHIVETDADNFQKLSRLMTKNGFRFRHIDWNSKGLFYEEILPDE